PALLGALQLGERVAQAPEPGIGLAGTRFGFSQSRFETGQEPNITLLPNDGDAASHLGETRLFGTVGPLCLALTKYRGAGENGWQMVSRHDIGHRSAAGRDRFGVVPQERQLCRDSDSRAHRRSVRRRFRIGEGAVGKAQRIVDSTEHPQCEGVQNLRYGARIMAEPVGEIAMACLIVELDGLLKMVMSAGKVAEI